MPVRLPPTPSSPPSRRRRHPQSRPPMLTPTKSASAAAGPAISVEPADRLRRPARTVAAITSRHSAQRALEGDAVSSLTSCGGWSIATCSVAPPPRPVQSPQLMRLLLLRLQPRLRHRRRPLRHRSHQHRLRPRRGNSPRLPPTLQPCRPLPPRPTRNPPPTPMQQPSARSATV